MHKNKLKIIFPTVLVAFLLLLITSCQREELKNLELEKGLQSSKSEDLGCACTEEDGGVIVEVNNSTYLKCPDGLYFEGDMAFTEEQVQNKSIKSRGYAHENNLWENGVIYLKNYSVNNPQHSKVYKAIKELEVETNLVVVPMDNTNTTQPEEYLQINGYASGNWAQYGAHSPSTMNLKSDVHQGIVIHELGHIAGLVHEHKRTDRASYVNYYPGNVKSGQHYNFDVGEGHSTHGDFDFNSIMIYGSYQWSKNGRPTLTKKDGSTWSWNLGGYSQGDVTAINSNYPNASRETIRHSMEGVGSDWQQSEATVFRPESNVFIVGIGVSVAGDNVTTLKVKYANINSTGETTATWIERAGRSAWGASEAWVEVPQGYVITGLGAAVLNDNVRTLRAYAKRVEHFEDGGNNNTKIRLSSEESVYNAGSQPNGYIETEVKLSGRTKTLQGIGFRCINDHMFNSKGYSYEHDLYSGNGNGTTQQVNLALNAVDCLQNSAYNNSYNCQKAYDGNLSTKWVSDGTSIQSSIVVDLGSVKNISKIIVKHAGANGEPQESNTEQFKIEYGSSNIWGPWTAAEIINNYEQANESELNFNFTARYVHLYIIDPGVDNYSRVPEIEIWGN